VNSPLASDPASSRGRMHAEPPSAWRTDFQRDRDRIIHATSFRRLKGKTQVFLAGEGDHYRTRLTHTLEVMQIARSLARALGFNEDLTEAIALAHDLGHPPFGHAGERALDRIMAPYGGFDHNIQSLRVVTRLEHRYPGFDGLNLTWETLEGLTKHNGPVIRAEDDRQDVHATIAEIDAWRNLRLTEMPAGEAQCAAIADDIAYNAHDLDDGLRSKLLTLERLDGAEPLARFREGVLADHPGIGGDRVVPEMVRRLIGWLVEDVIAESRRQIDDRRITAPEAIRTSADPVIAFSADVAGEERIIKRFLDAELYRNPAVTAVMNEAETVIADLFQAYWSDANALPESWRPLAQEAGDDRRARKIADFLAGMTDRFALAEHRRLFDRSPEFG